MPLFLVHALDKPGHREVRMTNRPAHLEWARSLGARVKLAGPLFMADGESFAGSVFIIEGEDIEAVHRLFHSDPYVKADLFERVEVRPFRAVLGAWAPHAD